MLQAFEIIVDKAKGSSLGEKFYQEADPYLGFVSDKLDISKRASAIMALFADRCDDSHIQFSDLTDFLDCRILSLLRYANEIQELVDKEYICRNRDEGFYYTIPMEVMEVFQHNERYNPMDVEELTARELFDKFDELFTKCRRRKIDKQVLRRKLMALVAKNEKLAFVKAMASYDVDADDMYFPLFVLFCTLFVVNGDDNIRYHDLEFIYKEGDAEWRCAKRGLSQGDHLFFVEKFIEYTNDDGFVDRESFKITDDAKKQLFSELNLSSMRGSRPKGGMLSFEDISPKQLFYNSKEQRQVEELTSLLDEEHFQRIKNRLKETNFRSGFACLFYGAPGTGKTETVLQIAKKTGRDLIQVNVSEQNIILQEIEQLDGILIATTNLAENMDKAFERRFLYKIQFEKPDVNCRTQIWQAMIPPSNDADASYLAGKYDFSGGEIENIARHFTIQTILHGKSENMIKSLAEFCESERLEGSRSKRKIGF